MSSAYFFGNEKSKSLSGLRTKALIALTNAVNELLAIDQLYRTQVNL